VNLTRTGPDRPHERSRPARGGRSRPAAVGADAGAARRRARNRSLVRDALVLALVVAGLAALWPSRLVANEDLPPAEALADRFDAAYARIRAGASIGTTPTEIEPGIEAIRWDRGGQQRWAMTGEAGSDCYALWWDEDGVRRARTLPSTMPCAPSSTVSSPRPEHFERIGRALRDTSGGYDWAPLLPDPYRYRLWFLPALIVLGGIGLSAAVRMTIAVLTGDAPSATRR
jgi:hypothetical protein